MAKFFDKFPKELYTLEEKPQSLDSVTNICTRMAFGQDFKENAATYYEYDIQEGEKPELIAHKLYGSPEQHWIVLMMNDIIDPYYDWPMSQSVFNEYINTKYSEQAQANNTTGIKWAANNVKSYYINEKRSVVGSNVVTEESSEVDYDTWVATDISLDDITLDDGTKIIIEIKKTSKTYFEYENELNESKRKIKLVRPGLAGSLNKEFKKVIS